MNRVAPDGTLRRGCNDYPYRYAVTPPSREWTLETFAGSGPALIDVAHWAAEWTWLPMVEARRVEALGDRVETRVSTRCTDPWQFRP